MQHLDVALDAAMDPAALAREVRRQCGPHGADAVVEVCGVPEARLHFLDLPLYNAAPRARHYGTEDVARLSALLEGK